MIKFENTDVSGWEAAIRGCRNPMNSWDKSDSKFDRDPDEGCSGNCPCLDMGERCCNFIGPNDMKMMKGLVRAGTDEAKFMRYIDVTVDITAPLYWWKEFDTYKVGTVANSCSTMHKIHDKEFTMSDFSTDHLLVSYIINPKDVEYSYISDDYNKNTSLLLEKIIEVLNYNRNKFLETKDKKYWWQMIQLLPSSYNQRRTVKLNYQVLRAMYFARRNHKLDEWREGFCEWVESLPYSELITMNGKYEDLVNRYADLVKENNQLVDEILHKNKEKEDVVG